MKKNNCSKFRGLLAGIATGLVCMVSDAGEVLTVQNTQVGTTPAELGYNLGHFMPGSNAADWFRYSEVNAARIFIRISAIEPSDDIAPVGDGVNSESSFFSRRGQLRSNAASTTESLSSSYVDWAYFSDNYADIIPGSNRIRINYALGELQTRDVKVLANLTASPSRFPISGADDWPGKWELWQHYYAEAFLLSRDYGVEDFSMFNEPNGWSGMTEADWLERYRICSDAIQSAVADMNSRYSRSMVVRVFAPNTANGAEKYNTVEPGVDETWGVDAVSNRHLQLDGTSSPGWMNLQVYNYQKYTTRAHASSGFSGYIEDYNTLRGYIDADTSGESSLPMAITEFNVRTGANYDTRTETQDSLEDFSALGANCVALAERGMSGIYMFKFGQTASSSFYGMAKNGSHYVENGSSGVNNYGGASKCADVYRLYCKASAGGRPRFGFTATAGASSAITGGVWSQITHDSASDTYYVFITNKEESVVPLEVDLSALPVASNQAVFVEEVSGQSSGGVVRSTQLVAGKLAEADLPAQSVWLVTVPGQASSLFTTVATADTQLGDGSSAGLTGGSVTDMEVRADGSANGRRVSLIQIPVPAGGSPNINAVLLELDVATSSGSAPISAHVYGVTDHSWDEGTSSWANTSSLLKQGIPSGNTIENNVVAGAGSTTLMLGELEVDSTSYSERSLEVTDYVKSCSGGVASFLIVQEHRWDVAQPSLTPGDTQDAGLVVAARESASGGARLVAITGVDPVVIETQPQAQSVGIGESANFAVTASGTGPLSYQWSKSGVEIEGADSSSFVISSVLVADAGSYRVTVTNPAGSENSLAVPLVVTAAGLTTVAREATVQGGTSASSDVDEADLGYLMVKFNGNLSFSRKSYFQFDLPTSGVDLDGPATFRVDFNRSFDQQVQLWGLDQSYPAFDVATTWNDAQANDLAGNGMLTSGGPSATAIGGSVMIDPGSGLTPWSVTLPRLSDFVFGDQVVLVLTGVDDPGNSNGGLRIAPGSSVLEFGTLEPWDDWRQSKFGSGWETASISGPNEDPDQDGVINLLEYALGGEPLVPSSGVLPMPVVSTGGMEIHFSRSLGNTDLRIIVQLSEVLDDDWIDVAESDGGNPFLSLVAGVTVTEGTGDPLRDVVVEVEASGQASQFVRLQVELIE